MTIQPKTDDLSQKLGDDSEIVCGCASLTIGNMRAEIKSGALSGFDEDEFYESIELIKNI